MRARMPLLTHGEGKGWPVAQETQGHRNPTRGIEALKHVAFAACCGVVCGVGSIVLCVGVAWSRRAFEAAPWLIWTLPVLGILQVLLYRAWHLPATLNTRKVLAMIRDGKCISPWLAPGILLGTCMSILGGGTVGKEAGALHMGASLGTIVSRPFHLHDPLVPYDVQDDNRKAVNRYVACTGMAAEFGALFFAPLGACMLVLELTGFMQARHVGTMLIAALVASCLSKSAGIGDAIASVAAPSFGWRAVGACIVLGVACALGGSLFSSATRLVQSLTQRISNRTALWTALGGTATAVLVTVFHWQPLTGTGGDLFNAALAHPDISWDFLIRMLLAVLSLGFWFKGGEIMVSLSIGALLGSACSVMTGGDPLAGAALGAFCFFAAAERVPLTAMVMGTEIFGLHMAPFLVIAVVVAFMFSYPIGIYGAGVNMFALGEWNDFKEFLANRVDADENVGDRGPFDVTVSVNRVAQVTKAARKKRRELDDAAAGAIPGTAAAADGSQPAAGDPSGAPGAGGGKATGSRP